MGLNMHLLVFADSFDMLRKFGKGQKLVSDVPQHASADLGRESRHVENVFTRLTMISRKFSRFLENFKIFKMLTISVWSWSQSRLTLKSVGRPSY